MSYTAKTNWLTDDVVTDEDLNRIEQGVADAHAVLTSTAPLQGQLSTDGTGWVASGSARYPLMKEVTLAGVTASDTVMLAFTLDTKELAQDADMSHVESVAGAIRLYAVDAPVGTVTFDYKVLKGV